MSDELATDEADVDEFEIDTLHHDRLEAEERADGKDGTPGGSASGKYGGVNRDDVVFDIGDDGEDSDDEGRGGGGGGGGGGGRKARLSDEEEGGGRSSEEGARLRRSGSTDRVGEPPRYSSLG